MSVSYRPPAPAASLRGYLERTSAVSKVIATLLVTLVSLRFAVASVQRALDVSQSNFAQKPEKHGDTIPIGTASAPKAQSSAPPLKPPSPPPIPSGLPRKMTLGVSAGPPRSDVYVNGRKVGQTPFLGDTSCKTGQAIRVEIMPPKGPPLVYSRDCTGGALEISGPPP